MTQELLSLLTTQTCQVTLLIAAVWFAVRLFAKDRPHLAHALWVLVLIKCITPPIWSSPVSPFSWLTAQDASVVARETPLDSRSTDSPKSGFIADRIVVHTQRDTASREFRKIESRPHSPAATSASMQSLDSSESKMTIANRRLSAVVWIWMFGVGIGFLVTIVRFGLFLYRIRSRRSELAVGGELSLVDIPGLNATLQRLARQLGVNRRVRLRVLEGPLGPAVLGLIRPTVLLPASIVKNKSNAELEPLLAHELIHIRRGDLWWALVQTIAKSLFWFHPLVWFAVRMVTCESERSCDEETVMCLGCQPATYARGLLEVLEHKHRLRVAPALPGVRAVDITSARLERVMNLGNGNHRRTPVWVWLVILVCGAFVLPGAALVFAQDPGLKRPILANQPLVPAKPRVDGRNNKSEWSFQIFEVASILQKIRQENLKTHSPEKRLILELPCRYPGPNGESSTPLARDIQLAREDGIIRLGDQEPTMKILNDRLFVYDTKEVLETVSNRIQCMREYGVNQIIVESKFIFMPRAELKNVGFEWSVAPSNVATLGKLETKTNHKVVQASTTVPLSSGNSGQPKNVEDAKLLPLTYPFDARPSSNVSVTSFVEKTSPVLYAVIEQDLIDAVVQKAKGRIEFDIIQAPTVTMFSGQEASVIDGEQRPFVVGLTRIKDPQGQLTDKFQPIVRVINEGTRVNLRATAKDADLINLDCQVELSQILSVDTAGVPVEVGEETAKIQIPEVSTSQIRSSLDVPNGQTLVLGSFHENSKREQGALLVMLKCTSVFPETPGAIYTPEKPNRKTRAVVTGSSRLPPVHDLDEVKHRLETTSRTLPGKTENKAKTAAPPAKQESQIDAHLTIRSEKKPESGKSLQPLIDALRIMKLNLEIDGKLQYEIDNSRILIRGEQLTLSVKTDDHELQITGASGEIEIRLQDELKDFDLRFSGNVRCRLSAMCVTADQVKYAVCGVGWGLDLEGSATLIDDEYELRAERIKFNTDDQVAYLEGGSKLVRKNGDSKPINIFGDKIEWNPATDEIRTATREHR